MTTVESHYISTLSTLRSYTYIDTTAFRISLYLPTTLTKGSRVARGVQYAHVQKLLRKKRRWLSGDLITGAASVDSGLELYQDFFL